MQQALRELKRRAGIGVDTTGWLRTDHSPTGAGGCPRGQGLVVPEALKRSGWEEGNGRFCPLACGHLLAAHIRSHAGSSFAKCSLHLRAAPPAAGSARRRWVEACSALSLLPVRLRHPAPAVGATEPAQLDAPCQTCLVLQFFFTGRVAEVGRASNEQKRTFRSSVSFPLNFKPEWHILSTDWGTPGSFLKFPLRQAQQNEAASPGMPVPRLGQAPSLVPSRARAVGRSLP